MAGRKTVYNSNMTEDWEKVNPKNQTLVKEYMQYLKSADKSPQTQKQYFEWLKVFFCWNYKENSDKFYIDLKKRDFVNYFGYLRDKEVSPNRIATLKSVLSSLSNEIELLYEDEYPNFKNQLRGMEAIHITKVREKTVISTEQLDTILNILVEKGEYQTACYLALICASGCRKAEAIQMKPIYFIKDAEVLNGYFYKTPLIRSKGKGKVGKMISKYVIKKTFKPYFDLWMKERKEKGINNEYLFVCYEEGQFVPATIATANSFARKISKAGDVEFYSHAGRHYFCTLLKSMNLPDDVIVQIFSWAESSGSGMIAIYDDTDKDKKIEKFFADIMDGEDDD